MARFRDLAGREWQVAIRVASLSRVREETGFELGKLLDEKLRRLGEIAADPELLCRVLYVLIGDQAVKVGVTLDQFFEAMAGDPLEEAFDAFLEAFADFCPSQRRQLLRTLARKNKEAAAEATGRAMAVLETSSTSPTDSPGSPESTPAG